MAGHREGVKAVREVVQACGEIGVEVLTLFTFSSENWRRPAQEVTGLLKLFIAVLKNEVKKLHENNVQLRVIGNRSRFSVELCEHIQLAEELTRQNTGLKLVIAADYGGQWDIVNAARHIARQVEQGHFKADAVTPELFGSFLQLADLPLPDLLIRTSGEWRISNFLLWQLAYAELYFTETFWPDFTKKELIKALQCYAGRERRFGYISEQVEPLQNA